MNVAAAGRGLVVIVLCAIASRAGAMCAIPRAYFLPGSGSSIPAAATVYLFAPYARTPLVVIAKGDGKELPLEAESLPAPAAFSVTRVKFDAAGRTKVELALKDELSVPAPYRVGVHYTVDPRWRSHAASPMAIAKVEQECSRWTCSYQETQNLELTVPAPAYRLEWARTRADYVAGRRDSIVLPHRMEYFFAWPGGTPIPSNGRIELGHVNCVGSAFEWKEPRIWVGVAALYEDGIEGALSSTPTVVRRPRASTLDHVRDLFTR